jgi:uncharacterized protein (TIGR00251 family)
LASLEGRRNREPADSRTQVEGDLHAWARQSGVDVLLHLHVVPGAKVAAVRGLHGERLKIAIDAPPAEGKANDALLDFLAAVIGMPRRRIHLHKGTSSRDKIVRVEGADASELVRRFLAVSSGPSHK